MTTALDTPTSLDHVDEDDLRLLVTGHDEIAPERIRHLAECLTCRNTLRGVAVSFQEATAVAAPCCPDRRVTPRRHVDQPSLLRVLSPFSLGLIEVRTLDISRYGAKVRAPVRLQPLSIVHLRMEEFVCLGQVRHCTPHNGAFLIGIRIYEVFRLVRFC